MSRSLSPRVGAPARQLASARLGWAAVLLAVPGPLYELAAGRRGTPTEVGIVRLLGLREVGQAAITVNRPTAGVLRAGAAVDALHALSMVALALGSAAHRRPALASGTLAAAASASGFAIAAGSRP